MYKLLVKKDFSSAHILKGHPGDCKRMHGHNWIVEAEIQGNNINNIGMVIDFKDIKRMLTKITDQLDHRFLNELEPFQNQNPTAENICVVIHDRLKAKLDAKFAIEITLYETPRNSVTYSGN